MSKADSLPRLTELYISNSRWLMEHLVDVTRDHPNQWVAVLDKRIVAADPDLGAVTAAAARVGPAMDTVFQFLDDGSRVFAEAQ